MNLLTDDFPLDTDGLPFANYVQVPATARPRFGHGPSTAFAVGGEPAIVVIGAGYTGLSAALHLGELRRNAGSAIPIVLLEAGHLGSGPSGKSGGHVCGLHARDDAVRRHCGRELGGRLIAGVAEGIGLVRSLIGQHGIPCDLRDGYVEIGPGGQQTLITDGSLYCIDPYPFVIGLARAALRLGVRIHEGLRVIGIEEDRDGCHVTTPGGVIAARRVIAAAGHRMAEDIPILAPLRRRTTELRVGTIITDPLPDSVLHAVTPVTSGRRYPFATGDADVPYGNIDRRNRIVFGIGAAAWRDPPPERIARGLHLVFPTLAAEYRAVTGRDLGWRPFVETERLCFTRDFLPNVGAAGRWGTVLYVQALGGTGIALGTLLGKAAAEKLWGEISGAPVADGLFDAFASVRHGWLPAWQPARTAAAATGLALRNLL